MAWADLMTIAPPELFASRSILANQFQACLTVLEKWLKHLQSSNPWVFLMSLTRVNNISFFHWTLHLWCPERGDFINLIPWRCIFHWRSSRLLCCAQEGMFSVLSKAKKCTLTLLFLQSYERSVTTHWQFIIYYACHSFVSKFTHTFTCSIQKLFQS